ncbi:MAG: enoyl-CoA hydratase/isomerase family protein [Alphaproteobacteria bacterium]|nr:enoyl-CoA hydratase/isomerase family protein [Alphaproteobacteria bacterium]
MGEPVVIADADGVRRITLNRPERGNALAPGVVDAVLAAVEGAPGAGSDLLVLTGVGKHFCTGFDLSDLDTLSDGDLLLRLVRIEMLLQAVHHAPIPTLAVAHGSTLGAGADLMAACQIRLATPGTRFAFPGAGFGITLGTRRLALRVGPDAARDLVGTGRRIEAEEACALGLVGDIVSEDAVDRRIMEAARAYARLDAVTSARVQILTLPDTREADLANLVASAARPGLKNRIEAYGQSVAAARRAGGSS